MTSGPTKPELVRAMGRWTLTALVFNGIVASGIFGLPDDVARLLGPAAPWAYVLGAIGIGVIMLVFAEVASQYRDAGGPYLWTHDAFGRGAGIQMGWFMWLGRIAPAAANTNLLVVYLGEFWPGVTAPLPRATIMFLLIGGLAAINVRGVRNGAGLSNVFTIAKLVPLVLFIGAGLVLAPGAFTFAAPKGASIANWTDAMVVLMYAFGGFEAAMIPLAEAKDPRRDAPFALITALAAISAIYLLVHLVAMWSLPALAESQRPLADAARVFAGAPGAAFIALGAIMATGGQLCSQVVSVPRLTYALAERGDFPRVLSAVHPRFRTPYISILLWAVLVFALAVYGNFIWNALLTVAARLVTYGGVCVTMIRLRRCRPGVDAWRAPAGLLLALLGIGFCALLILRMNADHARIIAVVALAALINWIVVRTRALAAVAPKTA